MDNLYLLICFITSLKLSLPEPPYPSHTYPRSGGASVPATTDLEETMEAFQLCVWKGKMRDPVVPVCALKSC
jgi:hypothetical protein